MRMSKKSAIGLSAAVTATGLGLLASRWSQSQGASTAHPELQSGAEADKDDWSFEDYLNSVSQSTKNASQTLAHVVRSARQAWEQRQAAAGGTGSSRPAAESAAIAPPSSAVLLADFLAALNDGPVAHRRSRGIQLVNSRFADYLLDRASDPATDPQEVEAILRYLSAVLRSQDGAEALLQRPGVAPRLLALAEQSASLQQLLSVAVARASAPRVVQPSDMVAVLELLSQTQPQSAQQHDGQPLGGSQQQHQQQLLGLQLLLTWAGASTLNATRLAEAGAGQLLADLAARSATGEGIDSVQGTIAQLMGTLARDARKPDMLRMQAWLYHLLCFAADAAASGQWQLAATSLSSFAACLLQGCVLPAQLMRRSTLPLLRQLAEQPEAASVRPAIALVVQALGEGPGVQLPAEEREQWTEVLLQWLVQERSSNEGMDGKGQPRDSSTTSGSRKRRRLWLSHGEVREWPDRQLHGQVTAALEALAAPAGSEGLHVAHAWLAELIVHLSHQVRPLPPERPPEQETAAAEKSSAASSSGSRWWWLWPFGGGGAPEPAALAGETGPSGDSPSSAEVTDAVFAAAAAEGAQLESPAPAEVEHTAADAVSAAGAYTSAPSSSSSWLWKPSWWPWGGGSAEESTKQPPVKSGGKPSDSELALYINAAPVGPLYARSVAAALLEASGRVGSFQEPPVNAEELMGPDAVAFYPQVAAAIDWDMADAAVCQALKVLCALASGGGARRAWLLDSGMLSLLHRLTMERKRDVAELPSAAGQYVDAAIPLCIQRQAVRLLAMLAADEAGAAEVQAAGWIPWLQDLAVSTDLKLSSCASRALLHIESAVATKRQGLADLAELASGRRMLRAVPAPLLPTSEQQDAAMAAIASEAGDAGSDIEPRQDEDSSHRGVSTEAAEAAAEVIGEARQALALAKRRLDRQLDAVRPAVPPQDRLVMQDGVHLFDPLAPHHEVLAREGITASGTDAPLLDIVFVHGIRGGAFVTWRREGVLEHGQARESLDRSVCWPASWVAKEIPEARLLSLEYAAPASGWEGESLPFQHIVAQLMEKLAAAGVGQRPVIFVCHSMGGLVVKDLLVTAKQQEDERLRRLNTSAAGAVFYAVPHAGSRLADWGWYLRYVGGAPAKHVQRLMTGHHQEELNAAVRTMCKSGQLAVLSFSEGRPTKLGYIPTHVVPHESAWPGYGEFVVLTEHDHISVCKPTDQADPAYSRLMAFLHARVAALKMQRAEAAPRLDHMETSVL